VLTQTTNKGKIQFVRERNLSPGYLDKNGAIKYYGDTDSLKYSETYVNIYDSNNLLTSTTSQNLLSHQEKISTYDYLKFDSFGNPELVESKDQSKGRKRIAFSAYQYY
jgi:hypothetical protein